MKKGNQIVNAADYKAGRKAAYGIGLRGPNRATLDPETCAKIGHGIRSLGQRPIGRTMLKDCMVIAVQAVGWGYGLGGNQDPWAELFDSNGDPVPWIDDAVACFSTVQEAMK